MGKLKAKKPQLKSNRKKNLKATQRPKIVEESQQEPRSEIEDQAQAQQYPKNEEDSEAQQLQQHSEEKAQKKSPTFTSLPNEMVEHVLEMLPLEDKKSARLVTSRWYEVLNRSVQFKMRFKRETLMELRRQPYEIAELEVMLNKVNIPQPNHFSKTMKTSLLTTKILSFMADDYYYPHALVPRINSLDGAGVRTLIKACRNMQTLKFNFRFLEKFEMTNPLRLNNVQLDYLHTLQLKLAYGGQQFASLPFLQLKTPQLRNLEVERFSEDETRKGTSQDRNIYLALQKFMAQNKKTLKSLKLNSILTNITRVNSAPTVFPAEMLNDLSQLRLESLEVHHRDIGQLLGQHEREDWTAANWILGQQSLTCLKLDMFSINIIQRSYVVIGNCRKTLTKLDLNVKGAADFNMATLCQLTRLTHLSFTSDLMFPVHDVLPPTITYLTWNAPLHPDWHSLHRTPWLPVLVKIIVGQPGTPWNLEKFCHVLYGISGKYAKWNRHTKLQWMILRRKPQIIEEVEREIVTAALRLPKQIYSVVFDPNDIRITIQSGISRLI